MGEHIRSQEQNGIITPQQGANKNILCRKLGSSFWVSCADIFWAVAAVCSCLFLGKLLKLWSVRASCHINPYQQSHSPRQACRLEALSWARLTSSIPFELRTSSVYISRNLPWEVKLYRNSNRDCKRFCSICSSQRTYSAIICPLAHPNLKHSATIKGEHFQRQCCMHFCSVWRRMPLGTKLLDSPAILPLILPRHCSTKSCTTALSKAEALSPCNLISKSQWFQHDWRTLP